MDSIIIFIKNIERGKVKTRLAATVGDDQALKIYEALLEHTQKVVRAVNAERFLFYSSFIEKKDSWSGNFFNKKVQSQGDLGSRMSNAFLDVFGVDGKAIIVGSDCASLTPEIIKTALEKLDEYPFVVGPTFDGGYYLLGMNSYEPSVFEDIEWSTETVFPTTLLRMASLKKRCFFLPQLSDIDYEEDWLKYGWLIK
ncbi:TIGR04282 family arsenosugar biosynthesis glycosyltransferase [Saprospiraceae bacterium]|nr:TIGR04282 family arsenosugar biosynthesis glycosyltransferase [Saprospiraceae bacterium]MDG1434610.1 TIGR04282 family arsenosugar biosynthesis glycosyltransferase [Saprospiraceae bacterium]